MALILTFNPAMAVVTSESSPTLFGMEKLISFTLFAFAIFELLLSIVL
jgi:hypothetical protein